MEWVAVAYLQYSQYGFQTNIRINNASDMVTGASTVNEPTCGYNASGNQQCNYIENMGLNNDTANVLNYNNTWFLRGGKYGMEPTLE